MMGMMREMKGEMGEMGMVMANMSHVDTPVCGKDMIKPFKVQSTPPFVPFSDVQAMRSAHLFDDAVPS